MLENLSPDSVFRYFEAICSIPHGSGNTAAISDFCVEFAEKHGLEYIKDALNNVIIKKPATVGFEGHPPIILQGHLDMVCEKKPDSDIDFFKDGLRLRINGDLLSAEGTTLGADDGIAVAMILAVLEDSGMAHPPIEAVFTVDEEIGMDGAEFLDTSLLSGRTLINIDSGEEGIITAGCAGGAKTEFLLPVKYESNKQPCFKIIISGLLGGHSGVDINKGRQNAVKLLAELLSSINCDFRLADINGGFKDNVIPNACECIIACEYDITEAVNEFIKNKISLSEPGLAVTAEPADFPVCFDYESHCRIIDFISAVPNGIIAMSRDIDGFVQSSANIGILKTESEKIKAVVSVRSSIAAEKEEIINNLRGIASEYNAEFSVHGHYPAWEYRRSSRLRDTMTAVYRNLFGTLPKKEAVHAGLECGLFSKKIPDLDAVSIGPNMWDIHTVNERLSIMSVERTYKYLCAVLNEL